MTEKEIPIYQIDAFTEKAFCGNSAAICPLDAFFPDETFRQLPLKIIWLKQRISCGQMVKWQIITCAGLHQRQKWRYVAMLLWHLHM